MRQLTEEERIEALINHIKGNQIDINTLNYTELAELRGKLLVKLKEIDKLMVVKDASVKAKTTPVGNYKKSVDNGN